MSNTHHPSFTAPVRKAFYARIGSEDIGMKGDPLAKACESILWPRPSEMTPVQRGRLLHTLTCAGFPATTMTLRRILEHRYRVAEEAELLDDIAHQAGWDEGYKAAQDERKHTAHTGARDQQANLKRAGETV